MLVEGHAATDAAEAAQRMQAVRAAVWAEGEDFARILRAMGRRVDGPDDPRELMVARLKQIEAEGG